MADGFTGLLVIDVSNPTNCALVGGCLLPGFGSGTNGFANKVTVSGAYAYVLDVGQPFNPLSGGLHIIDVSNPSNCVAVNRCETIEVPLDMVMAGNYAYVASFLGLENIYIGSGTNCTWVGSYDIQNVGTGVAVAGDYAYVSGNEAGLHVVNISDPTNCVRVRSFETLGNDANDVVLAGKHALVACGNDGVQIIDITPGDDRCPDRFIPTSEAYGFAHQPGMLFVVDVRGLLILPTIQEVQLTLRVRTDAGVPCTLETTTNLNAPIQWLPLLTTNTSSGSFNFTDVDVKTDVEHSGKPHKFYRAVLP